MRRDRWVVALAAIIVVLLNGGFSVLITKVIQDQAAAAQAQVQAQERRQGIREVRAICTGFDTLAALKPPRGNPKKNPSRAYLQGQHAALDEIGAGLGCNHHR